MKIFYLICSVVIFSACQKKNQLEIFGKSEIKDGSIIKIINSSDSTLVTTFTQNNKYKIPKTDITAGYYTISTVEDGIPHDFDVYLESGKYTIDIPKDGNEYLNIKTTSTTQNKLSDYYNFENNILRKFRQETKKWSDEIECPKNAKLSDREFENLVSKQSSARTRERGATIASMNAYIDQHPQTDILIHIIENMDYQSDLVSYRLIFDRLSPTVKNSTDGMELKEKLTAVDKNILHPISKHH